MMNQVLFHHPDPHPVYLPLLVPSDLCRVLGDKKWLEISFFPFNTVTTLVMNLLSSQVHTHCSQPNLSSPPLLVLVPFIAHRSSRGMSFTSSTVRNLVMDLFFGQIFVHSPQLHSGLHNSLLVSSTLFGRLSYAISTSTVASWLDLCYNIIQILALCASC